MSDAEFAAQYERHYRLLWVVAAGIAGPGAAADLVHQAALQGLQKLDQFQRGTDFAAWMAQIVRYIALNHARAAKRRYAAQLDGDVPDTRPDRNGNDPPLELTTRGQLPEEQQHFDDEVMAALDELSETARACLLLRTVQELSYSEIAAALDIPEGTAMSHVHRSRRHLRNRLQERSGHAVEGGNAHR